MASDAVWISLFLITTTMRQLTSAHPSMTRKTDAMLCGGHSDSQCAAMRAS